MSRPPGGAHKVYGVWSEKMGGSLLKRPILRALKQPSIGVPAAISCLAIGAPGLGRKISRECGYVPPLIDIEVPPSVSGGARFLMNGVGGRDQVARVLWLYGWDSFEKPMPDLFGACARTASRILDVGAYSGFYSLLGAICNPAADVFAFEPFPLIRETLLRNIALNHLDGRVRCIPAAVSDRGGTTEFFVPPNLDGWIETAASLDREFRDHHEQIIEVNVTTLETFRYSDGSCGPVDLIKIDAESVEHRVLAGGRRLLAEDRPIIFLEIIPGNAFCPQIEAIREKAGYEIAAIHTGGIDWRDHVEGVDTGNPHASNQILCPAEKKDVLSGLVESMGYRVSRMEIGRVPKGR